jgi:histidyl-tRNA synthetase
MIEIKDDCYKGTRILLGNEKRNLINKAIDLLTSKGYQEISIPIIQSQKVFSNKVGNENQNMMFNFTDRKGRELCLSPEYTAVVQKLSDTVFKFQKDVKLFYVQECFRGEKPQAGRYRQFTQLGIEILNPTKYYIEELTTLSRVLINLFGIYDITINQNATRGLDYYKNGKGFEITCERLGAQKQLSGGGAYEGGIGFAIGVDRIIQNLL